MSFRKGLALALAFALPLVFAAPAAVFAADAKGDSYKVDTSASWVKWLGKKVTGQHNGKVPVQSGELLVSKGSLTGGKVVIETKGLTVEDLSGEGKANLTGHLQSPDFFSTEKYPTSTFEITSVKKLDKPTPRGDTHEVSGNLTIKDKTAPLSFPAEVSIGANSVTAKAVGVSVDRTVYDIRYGSGKFFQGLGDKVINDEFWIDLSIVAKK